MKSIYTSHFLMSRIKFAFLVLFAGLSGISQAQIAAWQFGTPPSVGDELSYNATSVNQNVTVTALVRGSGISAYDLPNGFSSNTWNASSLANAITLNEYYEFKIQANEGFYVSLSSIDAILRRSPNGPRKYIWRYSVDGTTFSDISTYRSITSENENGVLQTQIDLTTIAELQNVQRVKTITLRLYAWDAITTSGTFAVGITPSGTSTNALTIGGTTGSAVSPVVSAQAMTNIINTTAIATGTVSTPGNPTPNEIGICWSTTIHPTISNFKAISESGISTGSFKAYLKNLTPNTLYYVRAYVTTGSVTTYSQEELTFTSGNAVPAIAHAATKNFTNKHNILAAGFYRGRTYSLYTVDTNDNLNIDDINVSDNLVISQDTYSDVSSSLSYTSGSVVVRNDTLFAFYRDNVNNLVFVRSFLSDKNGKLVKTDNLSEFLMSHIVNVDLPNHPMEKYFGTLIAGTVFNNDIYLILRRDAADDNRLYLIKGTPISGPNYVSFNWQFVDVVKDGNGTEISVNPTFSNNTDSYDLVTMKCKNGADSLVVGRSNNNKITLHLFRGVNNWVTYEKPVSSDVSKCFRMIQGAFEGSGAIETKNTLQCIGKNTEIVLTEAFDIDERQFVGEQKLTLHDGNFATSISVLNANPEQTYYKQYINIITGDLSTYTDVDIYKSNTLFCSSKTSTDNKKIILTPSLRPLATLFGVIEGTPPTIFETEQDYVNNNWVSSAKLVKVNDNSTSNKVSQSFTGGGEVKLGNDFCSVAVEYKRSIERNKTKTVTVSNTMTCADKEIAHRDSATFLYAVPDIVFNSYYLCSPQSSLTTKVNVIDEPILNDITIRDAQNIVKINRSLKDAPFNITKPRDFTYWANRPMFQNFTPNSTNSLYASSDFDFSSIQINRKIEVETEIQTEKSNEVTVTVEAKFFSALDIKASSSYKITKSHTSTINESLELQLASLLRYKFPQYNSVSFKCNAMLLTKGNTQVENNYYPALRAAKFSTDANVCEAHENPWIIAYNITNMSVDRVPSGVELVNDENSGLSLKLYRQSPALVSLAINSNSDDLLTVELFTLNGQKIQTLLSKQPIAAGESTLTSECSVPAGLYIVKSYTSSGLKSGLVRL